MNKTRYFYYQKKHYFSPLAALNKILKREYKVTIKQSFNSEHKKEDANCDVKQRINYPHLFKCNKHTVYIKQKFYNLKI